MQRSGRPVALLRVRLLGMCVIAGLLLAGITFPVVGGLGALIVASGTSVSASSPELARGALPAITTITDRAGAPIAYVFDQNRTPVVAAAVAPAMKAAIVAIEDRRFYSESGVDGACHDSRVSHGSVSGLNLSQWKSSGEEDDERVERYFPAVGPSS